MSQTSLPDELDIFRSANVRPQINLVVDQSCSMNAGLTPTNCLWWANQYNHGDVNLNKNQQVRAALVGCTSSDDGLIHQWYPHATMALREFPARPACAGATPASCIAYPEWCPCNAQAGTSGNAYSWGSQVAGFDASETELIAAAQSVGASGNTPMTLALSQAAKDFNAFFRDSNTKSCRPSYNILLTDGDPNGPTARFDFACNGVDGIDVPSSTPWLGAGYQATQPDLLCRVRGDQSIKTYAIGFGTLSSFNPHNLQQIAEQGLGKYYYAADVEGLTTTLQELVVGITTNNAVFFASPAVQRQGLFSDNYAYVAPYKPISSGAWHGNLKKICVLPRKETNGSYSDEADCLFTSPDGKALSTNPEAQDVWTATATTTADIGGAGLVILDALGTPGDAPVDAGWPRNVVTWRAGTPAYVAVKPSTWSALDAWVAEGDRRSFINQLNGYTFESTADGAPVRVGSWPLGDVVHSGLISIRYDPSPGACENTAGKCFVIFGANDGMVHFMDSATGRETTALIPHDLWRPNNVANDSLSSINDQPVASKSHRYYVDGGLRVFHEDKNGNGAIDDSETAYLVFGLGHGGRAYYLIPISSFDGILNAADNPIYPLTYASGDVLAELRDTWSPPWLGQMVSSEKIMNVAAFGSGHINAFDVAEQLIPNTVLDEDAIDALEAPRTDSCANAAVNGQISPSSCAFHSSSGYADPFPQDFTYGPFQEANAIAYRVHFSSFDLDPTATWSLKNFRGRSAAVFSQSGTAAPTEPWSVGLTGDGWTPWVFDSKFEFRVTTMGNGNPAAHRGFEIDSIEYLTRTSQSKVTHFPTVFLVDLARWNGATAPAAFTARPTAGAVIARFTRDCTGSGAAGGRCFDAGTSPDLASMRCPISGEVSTITVAGKLKSLYWGDECGQLWAAKRDEDSNDATWSVRRLLNLNPGAEMASTDPQGKSKDFRKIFRRLDTVLSTCPGQSVTGVYFGTGDIQRPAATDGLQSHVNSGRDVIGVVWDDGIVNNLTDADLVDATSVESIDPKADSNKGWLLQLEANEKMLRDPFVFFGVAYFKTFRPMSAAAECVAGLAEEAIYAVNNCTAEAEKKGERRSATEVDALGGGIFFFTPKHDAPLVSGLNLLKAKDGALNKNRKFSLPRILHWRYPEEY